LSASLLDFGFRQLYAPSLQFGLSLPQSFVCLISVRLDPVFVFSLRFAIQARLVSLLYVR
jgi:hypothetical protein